MDNDHIKVQDCRECSQSGDVERKRYFSMTLSSFVDLGLTLLYRDGGDVEWH